MPIVVQRVERVLLETFDQQAKTLLALAQLFLIVAADGEIAGHFGETEELAVLLAQRRDHHVGPESRAILAQAPAFILEVTVRSGGTQFALGPLAFHGLARVENGKVLPDDLVRGVALDQLCAEVPALYRAFRAEQEDGVIPDALNQYLEDARIVNQRGHGLRMQCRAANVFVIAGK